jgi:hypothetical protein
VKITLAEWSVLILLAISCAAVVVRLRTAWPDLGP